MEIMPHQKMFQSSLDESDSKNTVLAMLVQATDAIVSILFKRVWFKELFLNVVSFSGDSLVSILFKRVWFKEPQQAWRNGQANIMFQSSLNESDSKNEETSDVEVFM